MYTSTIIFVLYIEVGRERERGPKERVSERERERACTRARSHERHHVVFQEVRAGGREGERDLLIDV